MRIDIYDINQLTRLVYTQLKSNDTCIIKICIESHADLYVTSTNIDSNTVLLNLSSTGMSIAVGNLCNKNNNDIGMWINKLMDFINQDFIDSFNTYIELDSNTTNTLLNESEYKECPKEEISTYTENYWNNNLKIKSQTVPVRIGSLNDLISDIIPKFLYSDHHSKLIIDLQVPVKFMKEDFALELIMEKIYVPGITFISFSNIKLNGTGSLETYIMQDGKDINWLGNDDGMYRFIKNNEETFSLIIKHAYKVISELYFRCLTISNNNEVEVIVYSDYYVEKLFGG